MSCGSCSTKRIETKWVRDVTQPLVKAVDFETQMVGDPKFKLGRNV